MVKELIKQGLSEEKVVEILIREDKVTRLEALQIIDLELGRENSDTPLIRVD